MVAHPRQGYKSEEFIYKEQKGHRFEQRKGGLESLSIAGTYDENFKLLCKSYHPGAMKKAQLRTDFPPKGLWKAAMAVNYTFRMECNISENSDDERKNGTEGSLEEAREFFAIQCSLLLLLNYYASTPNKAFISATALGIKLIIIAALVAYADGCMKLLNL
ncbi:hypothetical protein Baya_7332 [Bagarius yarrelli]|uniref:Uncharacterized protein n=1 Tax=Bagarius yarrelli TaxID=175774 RepID=A0A556U1Q6_BAGYA|nr:hypothetical protein Baya_7332 [Bagarius yarrelli]